MEYKYFFVNEPDVIRKDLDIYITDIHILIEVTDVYIQEQRNTINKWFDVNIILFNIESPLFLVKPFLFFFQKVVDKRIDKTSENLSNADIYQSLFLQFQKRLEQIKYFS